MYIQTQTLKITLPKELVKKMDKVAKREHRNRSELICEALRTYISRMERWEKIFQVGHVM